MTDFVGSFDEFRNDSFLEELTWSILRFGDGTFGGSDFRYLLNRSNHDIQEVLSERITFSRLGG